MSWKKCNELEEEKRSIYIHYGGNADNDIRVLFQTNGKEHRVLDRVYIGALEMETIHKSAKTREI